MKPFKQLLFLLVLATALLQACGNSNKNLSDPAAQGELEMRAPVAGQYGMLSLGFDGKNLTGYYEYFMTASGKGCVFFLQGESGDNPISIEVYYPGIDGALQGVLYIKPNSVVLRLDDLPSLDCDQSFLDTGVELFRTAEKPWRAIRIVKDQVHFHSIASENSKTDKYLLPYNYVQVLEVDGNWLRVEYQGIEQVFSGWIPAASLFPIVS